MKTIGSRISVSIEAGIADVRLIRVDKRNAVDLDMMTALVDAGERLARMSEVRAVVLSGDGPAFCAGIDLELLQMFQRPEALEQFAARGPDGANLVQRMVMIWRDCPVPVIAAVHGVAFGAGFQLALGADMRYVDPAAQLCVMEIRWGLVPDMGGTILMREMARDDVVRELCFTGRVFDGPEALELGFATRVSADTRTEALAIAREIARQSPDAVRAAKGLLGQAAVNGRRAQLEAETKHQIRLLQGRNHGEAIAAARDKRLPMFSAVQDHTKG